MNMIKILIVDDSKTATAILKSLIEAEPDMTIIGEASDGQMAVAMSAKLKPDLITMDINMPVLNGYDATRLIMSQNPTPVVIISSNINKESMNASFEALEAGAVSVLPKPVDIATAKFQVERHYFIDTLRSMAQIKVFKRRFNTPATGNHVQAKGSSTFKQIHYEILAIGASVGGPQALHYILSKLPSNFPMPIVIVQHMAPGFIHGLATWLDESIEIDVKIADDNEILANGVVYFAPDGKHLTVQKNKSIRAVLKDTDPVSGFKPSITVLLESVAKTYGQTALAALLTGMGSDGAQGLLEIKKMKGKTFIQDAESAVVFGMAGVAQSLGAADKVISLVKMPEYLIHLINCTKL
jgi:two-component system chemotaxis response regulator CheB